MADPEPGFLKIGSGKNGPNSAILPIKIGTGTYPK
jgi:hypothetical protein